MKLTADAEKCCAVFDRVVGISAARVAIPARVRQRGALLRLKPKSGSTFFYAPTTPGMLDGRLMQAGPS